VNRGTRKKDQKPIDHNAKTLMNPFKNKRAEA